MEVISGVNNPRVKAAAELKQKKYREGLSPIGTQCEPMGLNAVYGEN